MPFKDSEAYRAYMRRYRQRKPGRKPAVDPEHMRSLAQAKGSRVATPRGEGVLLGVDAGEGRALVVIEGKAVSLPAEQVGLW